MNRDAYVVETPYGADESTIVAGPLPELDAIERAAEHENETGHHTIVAAPDVVELAIEHGENIESSDGVEL